MPKQVRAKTLVGGPQGEDARAIVLKLTHGEMRAFTRASVAFKAKLDANPSDLEAQDGMNDLSNELIRSHVVQWNWANEDGDPILTPSQDDFVIDSLTEDERAWLTVAIIGGDTSELEKKLG